ncbi:MAG: ExeA family protein [Thermodesulfovibrionales bacterium]
MYKEYFGLRELPFSIAPDPRYLFMSGQHREALAHLVFGISSDGGFILLTGGVGTGKTTVCRCLLEQVPKDCDIAFILNPKVTAGELLATLCDELRIAYPEGNSSIKVFVDRINAYLLDAHSRGRRTVLILEEAQNLDPEVLEQVRLLTNLETNQRKLLQIIMLGQPELRDMLGRDDLRQLSQRITARYHLGPLAPEDVAAYIAHRLAVAGVRGSLFPDATIGKICRLTNGIPRLINVLCDRALLGAYAQGRELVDAETLKKAAGEVLGKKEIPSYLSGNRMKIFAAAGFVLILLLASWFYAARNRPSPGAPLSSSSLMSPGQDTRPGLDTLWWFGGETLPAMVRPGPQQRAAERARLADLKWEGTGNTSAPDHEGRRPPKGSTGNGLYSAPGQSSQGWRLATGRRQGLPAAPAPAGEGPQAAAAREKQ